MNPEVKEVKVSPKGFSTTIILKDGTKRVICFENFLKVFGDYTKAAYEYITYVFAVAGSIPAIDELRKKLLGGDFYGS